MHPSLVINAPENEQNTKEGITERVLGAVLHQHGRDGVLDVAIGGSSQQLPEAALRQLHRALLLLLRRLQRRGGAAGRERGR